MAKEEGRGAKEVCDVVLLSDSTDSERRGGRGGRGT
jgi:hypothetical protein